MLKTYLAALKRRLAGKTGSDRPSSPQQHVYSITKAGRNTQQLHMQFAQAPDLTALHQLETGGSLCTSALSRLDGPSKQSRTPGGRNEAPNEHLTCTVRNSMLTNAQR